MTIFQFSSAHRLTASEAGRGWSAIKTPHEGGGPTLRRGENPALRLTETREERLTSGVLSALRAALPAREGNIAKALERLTGAYCWLETFEEVPYGAQGLRERAQSTARIIAKSSASAAGVYVGVRLALLGGTLAGPVGLIAGAGLGLAVTFFGSDAAERIVDWGFSTLQTSLANIREKLGRR